MIDLSKYTKHGKFKLHSGQYSDTFYDVKEMICDYDTMIEIESCVPLYKTLVGIETGGALISSIVAYKNDLNLAIITKDDKLVGEISTAYCLIDDAVTTENTIRKAIEIIGKEPAHIWVVIDRRDTDKSSLKIKSMFRV